MYFVIELTYILALILCLSFTYQCRLFEKLLIPILLSMVESVLLLCSVFSFGACNFWNDLLALQSIKLSWTKTLICTFIEFRQGYLGFCFNTGTSVSWRQQELYYLGLVIKLFGLFQNLFLNWLHDFIGLLSFTKVVLIIFV